MSKLSELSYWGMGWSELRKNRFVLEHDELKISLNKSKRRY